MHPKRVASFGAFLGSLVLWAGCVAVPAERSQTPGPAANTAQQEVIAAVIAGAQPRSEMFPSPDGQWEVEILLYGCVPTPGATEHAYDLLRFVRSGTGEWKPVDSQLINCSGLGAAGLVGLCWSPDSRTFYYTTARKGVPDGAGEWWPPVWQLDVASGAISELDGSGTIDEREDTLCTSVRP